MTLHEIEDTIQDLTSRHTGLDEGMLVTLLRAGGWEEKDIADAKTLFKGRVSSSVVEETHTEVAVEEKKLPDGLDASHLLPEHNEQVPLVIEPISAYEGSPSLVEASDHGKKEAIPHNLPLRPFETSEHIWPFSRYRDVFYGEQEHEEQKQSTLPPQSAKEEAVLPTPEPAHQPVVVVTPLLIKKEAPDAGIFKPAPTAVLTPVPLPPSEKRIEAEVSSKEKHSHTDENLVVLACFMLFAVLLLLGYMYSNGRL